MSEKIDLTLPPEVDPGDVPVIPGSNWHAWTYLAENSALVHKHLDEVNNILRFIDKHKFTLAGTRWYVIPWWGSEIVINPNYYRGQRVTAGVIANLWHATWRRETDKYNANTRHWVATIDGVRVRIEGWFDPGITGNAETITPAPSIPTEGPVPKDILNPVSVKKTANPTI